MKLDALPEHTLGCVSAIVVDPVTGESRVERRCLGFMINRTDVYAYRDWRGEYWRVTEDRDGKRWKERV